MAMGKRRRRGRQASMWVASSDLPRSAGHPFYERLNRVLHEAGFDAFVEERRAKFHADGVGWPSLAPDHSTVSRTRRRVAVETRLAHKAEHAVDLETSAVVGVTVRDADAGDTATMLETLVTAAEQVDAVQPAGTGIAELVCDKGYHSNQVLVTLAEVGIRSYMSEPARGRRNWRGRRAARDAVYANRRRIRGARGERLLRRRGERLERPNAHLYATGRLRRVHLRGHGNILKRVLLQACGLNLGLLMRQLMGVGTPRGLQGRACALVDALRLALRRFWSLVSRSAALLSENWTAPSWIRPMTPTHSHILSGLQEGSSATAC